MLLNPKELAGKEEEFEISQKNFRKYLLFHGSPEALQERINKIFNFLTEKKAGLLGIIWKNVVSIESSFKELENSKEAIEENDRVFLIIKAFLVLMDGLVFLNYFEENFLPAELKTKIKIVDIPEKMNFDISVDSLKKLKEKRDERRNKKGKK
jgi:hypothetical protein